ncbi:PPOX class F420-dependent oxidoreductase [Streptomonospora nanhaiensis]|uniref:PPOX class probable F420-dependent enzyme n=1 Tax=Streptomonospora nanhaiensis TaxID=1323731 RepID=A0A853BVF2_9ACTN|nr:PPOX class F420-dependent oxidoreductase [Streptomonospora nanhaiensis]MBV2366746.1 PPOX class F420-dependent oxidoreductase [Streptomonospora nanhaiensis]MBX9389483.1 PPOX class F420-dependent oxidoreductase [Streptomonospora nanhaiensis]NYI98202.1 PPOX class probable F420-dependent enzyme [Streptomonospora nanhaiensis]
MASISDPRVREILRHGTRTGKLAFTASDGRPLVAPVWFLLEGDDILFTTGKDTAKGRAIARDPRLSICVDVEEPPYAFVQVQGVAEVSEDPAELLRVATDLGGRYMGPERAEEFGRRNGVPGELLVRIRPTRVLAGLDMAD